MSRALTPDFLATVVPLRDPATGQPTGATVTIGAAILATFSVLRHLQLERDALSAAAALQTPPEP